MVFTLQEHSDTEFDVSVSKLSHFLDGFGFGIGKIWYREKYRIRYRKKYRTRYRKNWYQKKFRMRFRSDLGEFWVTFWFPNFSVSKLFHSEDGFGFGIEKIWYREKF